MSRNVTATTRRRTPRPPAEHYCRRDNMVYDVCPYAASGSACPCVQGMETADALFEINNTDLKPAEDRGPDGAIPRVK